MTLRGRTILVTRQREQAAEMVREIEKRGGTAVVIPMIAIAPPPAWEEPDAAIGRLDSYDLLVFTSANAVESFVGRTRTLGVPPALLSRAPAAAVGDATASALRSSGLRVVLVPEKFSGASLAAAVGGSLSGKRVLIPLGDIARTAVADSLRAGGARVDTVTVYVTSAPADIGREGFVRRVLTGGFDVLTFASPSAAANFGGLFGAGELSTVPGHTKIAVIGPSTADAVTALGLPVDIIARESTAAGLIRGIEDFYS